MHKYTVFIFFLALSMRGVCQNVAAQNDSLGAGDAFFETLQTDLLQKRKAMLEVPDQRDFWKEFTEKFQTDFNTGIQHKKMLAVANIDIWEIGLFKARRQQTDFYKKHPKYSNFSDAFRAMVDNQIKWNYWHLVVAHPVVRANADAQLLKIYALPPVMLDGLDPKKISDSNALMTEPYRQFLVYYLTYVNSRNRQFEKYKNWSLAMTDKATTATQSLTGEPLQYYLTRLLYDYCNVTPAEAIKQTISKLAETTNADQYLEVAQSRCADALLKKEESLKVAEKEDKTGYKMLGLDGKEFSTGRFKGKYIYLDFWATWCGPCRKEMPASQELMGKLTEKQRRKIVFLYVSIDESQEAWRKTLEALKLQGEHGWSPEMGARLGVESIPRYLIIDKDGKIMNSNAKRPSDPAILEELLKLLES